MAPAPNSFGIRAQQNIDDVLGAEALACAGDARKDLLRRNGGVCQPFDFVEADVACPAIRLCEFLAEIFGQFAVAAMDAGAKAAHVIEQIARGGDNLVGRRRLRRRFFNQRFPAHHVGGGIEQHAFGLQAVAPGAAGLLLVMLDGFRHGGVDNAAHVATVDAHAEGHRCGHDVDLFGGKCVLRPAALVGLHAGMIESGALILSLEDRRHGFGVLAADAIDDRRLAGMALQHLQRLRARVDPRDNAIDQIGTVERAHQHGGILRRSCATMSARTRSVAVAV